MYTLEISAQFSLVFKRNLTPTEYGFNLLTFNTDLWVLLSANHKWRFTGYILNYIRAIWEKVSDFQFYFRLVL